MLFWNNFVCCVPHVAYSFNRPVSNLTIGQSVNQSVSQSAKIGRPSKKCDVNLKMDGMLCVQSCVLEMRMRCRNSKNRLGRWFPVLSPFCFFPWRNPKNNFHILRMRCGNVYRPNKGDSWERNSINAELLWRNFICKELIRARARPHTHIPVNSQNCSLSLLHLCIFCNSRYWMFRSCSNSSNGTGL